MKVWILKEGEKKGPYHDFEVRSMIREGEVSADELVWHRNMEKWEKIGDLPLFADDFDRQSSKEDELEALLASDEVSQKNANPSTSSTAAFAEKTDQLTDGSEQKNSTTEPYYTPKTPEGERIFTLSDGVVGVYLWRRVCCRIFEFFILLMLFFGFFVVQGQNPLQAMQESKSITMLFLCWGLFENFCIHFFGSSFGKALFGLRVEQLEGRNLSLLKTIIRTCLTMIIIFLSVTNPIFCLFVLLSSVFFSKVRNALPWDIYARSQVRALPMTKMRVFSVIFFLIGLNIFISAITPLHLAEEIKKQTQEQLQQIQEDQQK